MDSVARGQPPSTYCSFIEPTLEIQVVLGGRRPVLRVYFELEARPAWAYSNYAGKKDLWVEVPLEELDLRSTARQ